MFLIFMEKSIGDTSKSGDNRVMGMGNLKKLTSERVRNKDRPSPKSL